LYPPAAAAFRWCSEEAVVNPPATVAIRCRTASGAPALLKPIDDTSDDAPRRGEAAKLVAIEDELGVMPPPSAKLSIEDVRTHLH
jgi:hypothetical protein